MKPTGNKEELEEYVSGWTTMMITIWQEKIRQYNIIDTGALLQSFVSHIARAGNDDAESITHEFNLYGVYVERGHGKGRTAGNANGRPWLHSPFYRSAFAIRRFLAEHYGIEGTRIIMKAWENTSALRKL